MEPSQALKSESRPEGGRLSSEAFVVNRKGEWWQPWGVGHFWDEIWGP